jgi:hypothetical protein
MKPESQSFLKIIEKVWELFRAFSRPRPPWDESISNRATLSARTDDCKGFTDQARRPYNDAVEIL